MNGEFEEKGECGVLQEVSVSRKWKWSTVSNANKRSIKVKMENDHWLW